MDRVRYKCNSTLDQVRVVWGSELHPRKFSIFCLLSRCDISHKVGSGQEPTMMEDVEDVEDRKVDTPRRGPRRCPLLHSGSVRATGNMKRGRVRGDALLGSRGTDGLRRVHGGKRSRSARGHRQSSAPFMLLRSGRAYGPTWSFRVRRRLFWRFSSHCCFR